MQIVSKLLDDVVCELGVWNSSSFMKKSTSELNRLSDAVMMEFRQLVTKFDLPMSVGEYPAVWISRAEVYFVVQDTYRALKVSYIW